MAKKPLQFQVSETFRQEIDEFAKNREITLSDFLRKSVRLYMILNEYTSNGYKLVLKKDDENSEKEILVP